MITNNDPEFYNLLREMETERDQPEPWQLEEANEA